MNREQQERRLAEAVEAHEREFAGRVVRVQPEVGDEFFVDIPVGLEVEDEQRQALTDFRAALARARPKYVRPEDTSGSVDYLGGYLNLCVRHAMQPDVRIELILGDGYLSLKWPWGEEHDKWSWSSMLAEVVEALLTGQNRQAVYVLANRPVAADTWILTERGKHKLRRWRAGTLTWVLPARLLPSREASISFDDPAGVLLSTPA